jgi:hypothetical protein
MCHIVYQDAQYNVGYGIGGRYSCMKLGIRAWVRPGRLSEVIRGPPLGGLKCSFPSAGAGTIDPLYVTGPAL